MIAGQPISVYANGASRPATILALTSTQMLVEYQLPGGNTALLCFDLAEKEETWWGQNKQYRRLSEAWLKAIAERGVPWIGRPRQRIPGHDPLPSASSLLQQRRFLRFWKYGTGHQILKEGANPSQEITARSIFAWIKESLESQHVPSSLRVDLLAPSSQESWKVLVTTKEGAIWIVDPSGVREEERKPRAVCPPSEQDTPALVSALQGALQAEIGKFASDFLFPTPQAKKL